MNKSGATILNVTLTDHCCPPGECCPGALEEVINRICAQEGLHQASVDIDPAGYHHPAVGLDHLDSPRYNQILSHLPAKDWMYLKKGEVEERMGLMEEEEIEKGNKTVEQYIHKYDIN